MLEPVIDTERCIHDVTVYKTFTEWEVMNVMSKLEKRVEAELNKAKERWFISWLSERWFRNNTLVYGFHHGNPETGAIEIRSWFTVRGCLVFYHQLNTRIMSETDTVTETVIRHYVPPTNPNWWMSQDMPKRDWQPPYIEVPDYES